MPNRVSTLKILGFCVAVALSGCAGDLSDINDVVLDAQPIVEHGEGVEIIYSEEGKLKLRMVASKVNRHLTDDPYIEFMDGVEVFFYGDDQEVMSTIRANYGIREEETEKTFVKDDVVVVNEKGERLSTQELTWNKEKKKIYTDKYVQIETEDAILRGDGFEADERFTRYKILKPKGPIKIAIDD